MDPELITVAVCSVGDAAAELQACLGALAAAGVSAPLVLSGSSGISILRNEALASCDTPVIAFVDDDVVVEEGWFAALADAWERAGPDIACIGGPLSVRTHPDSPEWLTDEYAQELTAATPLRERGILPSSHQTFCAGNVSFRRSALTGVGGFWPAFGAGRLRDWCSEEHHAQHELDGAGWKAVMDPAMRGARVVKAPSRPARVLAAQLQAGARRALVGGDSRELADALRVSAGGLKAAAKLNRHLAMQRLGQAANHAGTLAPTAIAGKTLEPAASSTPFRHSIPSGKVARKDKRSPAASAYCYHRVVTEEGAPGIATSADAFHEQLRLLLLKGDPVGIDQIAGGNAPRGTFAITFDDGYADNLHVALPILEEFGIPATFFVTTGAIESGDHFWWDRLARAFSCKPDETQIDRGILEVTCGDETRAWWPRTVDQCLNVRQHLVSWFQSQPPEHVEAAIDHVEDWSGRSGTVEADRPMTPSELAQLAAHPLATIGAHTRSHINLRFCDGDRLRDELAGTRDDIKRLLGQEASSIAYPFGVWGSDVDHRVVTAAREAGYETGVLNGTGTRRPDPLATPRSVVGEETRIQLA